MTQQAQQHSTGPWKAKPWLYDGGKRIVVTIRNEQDAVAQITHVWRTDDTGPAVDQANAAFIVRAANAHDALLEAAEAALGVLGAFAQTPPEFYQLSAAIAAARGEQ
jgi:hypothetical protein